MSSGFFMSIANDLNDAMAASGDTSARMKVSSQARKKNPTLQVQWQVHVVTYEVGGKQKTVLASLPVDRFSAAQVATLYHERWEIELEFRDIKSSMQHNAIMLRSKTVELVYQERWGYCWDIT